MTQSSGKSLLRKWQEMYPLVDPSVWERVLPPGFYLVFLGDHGRQRLKTMSAPKKGEGEGSQGMKLNHPPLSHLERLGHILQSNLPRAETNPGY